MKQTSPALILNTSLNGAEIFICNRRSIVLIVKLHTN